VANVYVGGGDSEVITCEGIRLMASSPSVSVGAKQVEQQDETPPAQRFPSRIDLRRRDEICAIAQELPCWIVNGIPRHQPWKSWRLSLAQQTAWSQPARRAMRTWSTIAFSLGDRSLR